MKKDEDSCEECKFWNPPGEGDSANAIKFDIGHCHRFPPVATVRHNRRFAYPEVAASDYCGEFKPYETGAKH